MADGKAILKTRLMYQILVCVAVLVLVIVLNGENFRNFLALLAESNRLPFFVSFSEGYWLPNH